METKATSKNWLRSTWSVELNVGDHSQSVAWLVLVSLVQLTGCRVGYNQSDPCWEVACSGRGVCVLGVDRTPGCECLPGFRAHGLECLSEMACVVDTDCDDGNPCTDDRCVILDGCRYDFTVAACDDSDPCSSRDRCVEGDCVSGPTDLDVDGDGRFDGSCPGGRDCDDQDLNNWASCATCRDEDLDDFFIGCDAYASIAGPDCDDADGSVYPGAVESLASDSCADDLDNDCDGLADNRDPDCFCQEDIQCPDGQPCIDSLCTLVGDVNQDGCVDDEDLNILSANWGQCGAVWGDGDLTGDGCVDSDDLAVVATHWNAGC